MQYYEKLELVIKQLKVIKKQEEILHNLKKYVIISIGEGIFENDAKQLVLDFQELVINKLKQNEDLKKQITEILKTT